MGSVLNDYDSEFELSAPHGGKLKNILIDVDIQPQSASCVIYGITADGHTEGVTVLGGHHQVSLPFAHPKIYVKHNCPLEHIWIGTIGYQ